MKVRHWVPAASTCHRGVGGPEAERAPAQLGGGHPVELAGHRRVRRDVDRRCSAMPGIGDRPLEVDDDRLGHTHRRAVGRDEPRRPEWRRAGERCRVLPRSGARDNPWIAGSRSGSASAGPVLSTSTQPNIEATPAAFRAVKRLPLVQPDIYIPPVTSSKQSRIAPRPTISSVTRPSDRAADALDVGAAGLWEPAAPGAAFLQSPPQVSDWVVIRARGWVNPVAAARVLSAWSLRPSRAGGPSLRSCGQPYGSRIRHEHEKNRVRHFDENSANLAA